ncbi:MAG: hypothetical protein ABI972_04325 [Acidobacteriota bacterium]
MLLDTQFHGRRAAQLENDLVRVTVLGEGGHIAEVLHKESGVNPLWMPPWPTIEPGQFGPQHYATYGDNAEGRLLAGIMGHNLCLDIFGGPSAEESKAGLGVHGEGSVASCEFAREGETLVQRAELQLSRLGFERRLRLDGSTVLVEERVTNRNAHDWPTAWTQHVTMGEPFIEPGVTQFEVTAGRSKVFEGDFAGGLMEWQKPGAEFDWPNCPMVDGSTFDLRVYPGVGRSAGYTTHLLEGGPDAFFRAYSPRLGVKFGYQWKRSDFPWIGRWEENCLRTHAPWNGRTRTCGMEFGVSPMPESRREMIERGSLFGVRGYRWLPAGGVVTVPYQIDIGTVGEMPQL